MKLLLSQRDTLYEYIENRGLSPAQFEFEEKPSDYSSSSTATILKYKNSEYHFTFETVNNARQMALFCPGSDIHTGIADGLEWSYTLQYFGTWISNLLKELNTPNKWARLQSEIGGLSLKYSEEDGKFSFKEYEELQMKIEVLKGGLSTIDLLPDQIKTINEKLDHLMIMAKDMGKFDWKGLFIGTIVNTVIQLAVTQSSTLALWNLIKQAFNNYFLS